MKITRISAVLLIMAISSVLHAQDRFITREGKIKFFSHAPVEDIEADNNKVLSIIDLSKGQVAVDLLIKAFEFEKKLMQEHFNENYMESGKFPKSTFKGNFSVGDDLKALKDGSYTVQVEGELLIHGVSKPLNTEAVLEVKSGTIVGSLKFKVKLADHDIKIPNVVSKNIAEEVEVTAEFNYEQFKRG